MQQKNVQNFRFIFYVLRSLANQKNQINQQPDRLISDEDRTNLQWLNNYFKRTKGDVSNTGI